MHKSKTIYATIVAASLVLAGAVYLLPSFGNPNPLMVHSRAAVAMLSAALACSAAVWFMSGLSSFQPKLRRAYRWIGTGVIMFALSLAQLPVVGVLNLWDSWYSNSGMLILPFVLSTVVMYAGLRKFARLLDAKSWLNSWRWVLPVVIAFTIACGLIAGPLARYPFDGVETYVATVGWCFAYLAIGSYLAFRIYQVVSQEYKRAMLWLTVGVGGYAVSALHDLLANLFISNLGPYFGWGGSLIIFVIAGFLYLEAGRQFYLLALPYPEKSSDAQTTEPVSDRDFVDSILSVAGMAARTDDIDPILDELRMVTATQGPELRLTKTDRLRLLAVYQRLETYLLTKERVRIFTQEDVRHRTRPAFQALLTTETTTAPHS